MIRNYLKIALRNLTRNKVYVLINTLGMGIAMACCLTAYLLVAYNIEFDDYFNDDQVEHVVKVMHHYEYANGERDRDLTAPMVMAPRAVQEIAAIEDFVRYTNHWGVLSAEDHAFNENLRFADASFFDLFKMGLKSGSFKNFQDRQAVFLSEETAEKYFADEDPLGKTMTVEFNNKKYDLVVGGVLDKLPLNISFHIQALLRIETFIDAYDIQPDDWGYSSAILLKLSDIEQRHSVGEQLNAYAAVSNEEKEDVKTISYELLPFHEPVINGEVNQSDLRLPIPFMALFIFSALGGIILLIACFNLTNTTIALTGKRMKEIGVRKVMGSARRQIIGQFLLEMLITITLAIVAGLLMAQIIVPQFAAMWQLQFGLNDLNSFNLVLTLIILLFITATLAGIYPALFSSRFRPVELLKGGKQVKGTNAFTRILLVFQFSLSVIVLIAGTVFTQNAAYQRKLSLGYDKERMINVSVQDQQTYEHFKNAMAGNPKIEAIAGAENHIGPYTAYETTVKLDTATAFKTDVYHIGAGYLEVAGLEVISGRGFIAGSQVDHESSVLVDENFIKNHRLTDPMDTRIFFKDQPYKVVGVVKNHLSGLKESSSSEHIYKLVGPAQFRTLVVRAGASSSAEVQKDMEKEWKKLFPDKPFQTSVQDDLVYADANAYNHNLKRIFFFLTVLGTVLSVCGIYALASLNVQKRTKEIGVRKVLGATVSSIIQLLNREFAIILAVAMMLGGAGGFFLTGALLNDLYAQHIDISILAIILCGLLIFTVGISATSGTIFKAAVTNPSETLRDE